MLMVEELFVNTVTHGHGGDCDAPVRVGLDVDPQWITLAYSDTAPPYNPFGCDVEAPDETLSVEERPVGGVGVYLIVTMADHVEYAHAGGWNRIRVLMRPDASHPTP